MNLSSENVFPMTKQLIGTDLTNTTRLIILKSTQADISYSPTHKTWVIPKANKRSYLQTQINLQQLRMWNTFKTVPKDVVFSTSAGNAIIYSGNWTPETLANYLTKKLTNTTVTYDPYNLRFVFCPPLDILASSTANKYLGFPTTNTEILAAQISEFPPVDLAGLQCVCVHSNFTMNNLPYSTLLASVPVNVPYGGYIYHTNFNDSEGTLCLDSDIRFITIELRDTNGTPIDYPETLEWEIILATRAIVPEGFAPLEA